MTSCQGKDRATPQHYPSDPAQLLYHSCPSCLLATWCPVWTPVSGIVPALVTSSWDPPDLRMGEQNFLVLDLKLGSHFRVLSYPAGGDVACNLFHLATLVWSLVARGSRGGQVKVLHVCM